MTAGFFSPLPPARTGVADYAAALLTELRRHGRVEVAPARSDAALYHLGNNPLHAGIYRRAIEKPGVVVLHDAALNHFFLGQLSETEYVDEFVYNYGEWNRGLGRELWRARAGSAADERYFRYPMLKRAAERALAVVVHNPAAAAAVRDHAPEARVVEIPHLFAPPQLPDGASVLRYRSRLKGNPGSNPGVEPGTFLFGIFGYLRESKRVAAVLEAFRAVHAEFPRTALLLAGQFVSTDLERAVAPILGTPGAPGAGGIFRLPYLPEREFWLAARAVDACINLRYPAAGESSGIAVRLMGIGKPVLLTDGLEAAPFPEGACVRIAAGPAERDSLRQHMVLLTSMAEVARAIGQRGAGHIAAHHRVEPIGKRYWDLLSENCIRSGYA
jgi:glycosyltransferase involved in cell wall biosynthesis